MGYDFYMYVKADIGYGEQEVRVPSIDIEKPPWVIIFDTGYTYNVSGMFEKALGKEIRALEHKTGAELESIFKTAVKNMEENPEEYRIMNPPNGWGDYEGALEILKTLRDWCKYAPKAFFGIS